MAGNNRREAPELYCNKKEKPHTNEASLFIDSENDLIVRKNTKNIPKQ